MNFVGFGISGWFNVRLGVHLMDIMLWGCKSMSQNQSLLREEKEFSQLTARERQTIYCNVRFWYISNTWEHYMGIGAGQYGRGHGIAFIGN